MARIWLSKNWQINCCDDGMATVVRLVAAIVLVVAVATGAAAQTLKPEWSRPVGSRTRLVGVEEYGRCSVFVDNGVLQVISPANEVMWSWPFAKISRLLNPRDVAVSHNCDAVALVGDASYKRALIAERGGRLTTLAFEDTPAEIAFDRADRLVAVGTYIGSLSLFSRDGGIRWTRATEASIVQGLTFSDDNQRISFKSFAGEGSVSVAGQVEWSKRGSGDNSSDADPAYQQRIAVHEGGTRAWQRTQDSIECVDDRGTVLATIASSVRNVKVSRDFSQVLLVTEKDLRPVSVERYEIPAPCRP